MNVAPRSKLLTLLILLTLLTLLTWRTLSTWFTMLTWCTLLTWFTLLKCRIMSYHFIHVCLVPMFQWKRPAEG